MGDVIFVAVIGAFFALCVVYVRWCDRIIGFDVADSNPAVSDRELDDAAASAVGGPA